MKYSRYHVVQEFNKGVYDYIIATDESGKGELDEDDREVEEVDEEAEECTYIPSPPHTTYSLLVPSSPRHATRSSHPRPRRRFHTHRSLSNLQKTQSARLPPSHEIQHAHINQLPKLLQRIALLLPSSPRTTTTTSSASPTPSPSPSPPPSTALRKRHETSLTFATLCRRCGGYGCDVASGRGCGYDRDAGEEVLRDVFHV